MYSDGICRKAELPEWSVKVNKVDGGLIREFALDSLVDREPVMESGA